MKLYLRVLSLCYFLGFMFHLLDIFDLRLKFSEMNGGWKIWIFSLMVADIGVSIGLWKQKTWGIRAFFGVALAQLIAYSGFLDTATNQIFLVIFHLTTLGLYLFLRLKSKSF